MVKVTVTADCGDSPKIQFIKKISIAFACGDSDFLLERITDKFVWDIVGNKKIEDIEILAEELESRRSAVPSELMFEQILTHRKEGAVNGVMKMPDGNEYSFSDFYEFRGTKIRKITAYVIKVK